MAKDNEISIKITKDGFDILYNGESIKSQLRLNDNAVQPVGKITDIIENEKLPNYLALMIDNCDSSIQEIQNYIYDVEVKKNEDLINPDVSDYFIDDTNY